jgi:hypothetical protein
MSSKTEWKIAVVRIPIQKQKKNNGCNGKCGHAMCSVTSLNIGIVSPIPLAVEDNVFNFSNKRQKFHQSVSFTSAGYSSIWLIPKIS